MKTFFPREFAMRKKFPLIPPPLPPSPPLKTTPASPDNLQPCRIPRIRQPIAAGMPRDTRSRLPRRQASNILARLDMSDIEPEPLVAASHNVAAVPAETDGLDAALHASQRATADPVRGVPKTDEGVGTPDGKVTARGREFEAKAG